MFFSVQCAAQAARFPRSAVLELTEPPPRKESQARAPTTAVDAEREPSPSRRCRSLTGTEQCGCPASPSVAAHFQNSIARCLPMLCQHFDGRDYITILILVRRFPNARTGSISSILV